VSWRRPAPKVKKLANFAGKRGSRWLVGAVWCCGRGQNGAAVASGQAPRPLGQLPVGCGRGVGPLEPAGWQAKSLRGGGCHMQTASVGGAEQPNNLIHANWQAGFLLGLVLLAEAAKLQLGDAHFANRVIRGR